MMNYILSIASKIVFKISNSVYYKEIEAAHNLQKKYEFLKEFKSVGTGVYFPESFDVKNPKYISIGDNFSSLRDLRLEAWDSYMGDRFSPQITIGNNVCLNADVHIGCINKIVIGNNVLMASRIYISDHSHGEVTWKEIAISPVQRKLYSKGPVIIGDNVWIGENVSILPGITIGTNAIIGANAVVTHDVPANAVVGGNPARIIKTLD